jgi:hypothetical protein
MSGRGFCKRNNYKRDDCFDRKECDFNGNNWGEYGCGEKKCEREQHKNNRDEFDAKCRNEGERAFDECRNINKHSKHDNNTHKLDKEFEDRHKSRKHQECKAVDNICNADHSSQNKKYLVDKLYIYEHHRVIDLNCCENDRKHNEAHKDFKDLECAIDDFKEADVCVKNFSDENRKDLEAYENARCKTRDLQANAKHGDNCYSWSA